MMLPLPIASYAQASRNPGRLVNCYAQQSLSNKGPVELLSPPGIVTFSALAGPGRGMFVNKGVLYAVGGQNLYQISSNGTATSLGAIPGSDRLTITGNDVGEIVTSNNYIYDGATVGAIADADAPTFSVVDYVDGYIVAAEAGTDRFYCSALRDATSWGSLDYSGTIASSDELVTLVVDHNQVILGGEASTEIFWLSGASGFPFERLAGGTLELGWAAKLGRTKIDNSVFWLASDLTIRRLQGQTPVRVSQHGVEEKIASYATVSDCEAFSWTWGGQLFAAFRFPSAGACWVYSVTTGEWHERETYSEDGWLVTDAVHCYGKVFVQHATNGDIGYLDAESYTEFSGTLRREATFPQVYGANRRLFFGTLELVCKTGDAPINVTPYVTLEISNDGGSTWRELPRRELGLVGEYAQRIRWHRLGSSRDRVFRIACADAVPFRVLSAELEVAG